MKLLQQLLSVIFCTCILCGYSSCISEDAEEEKGETELKVGETIPDFSVTLNDGRQIKTADLKGAPSLIFFFNTYCPDCQKEFPILQRLYEEYGYSITFFGISRKEEAFTIKHYWKLHRLTLPYSAQKDATIYHLFASSRIPRVYIVDAELKIRAIFTDQPVASYEDLVAEIEKLEHL